jgi:hypothetical protein
MTWSNGFEDSTSGGRQGAGARFDGQRGVALLTVLLMLMVMTVIGIASITLTGLESRVARSIRAGEAATVAAESCLHTAVITIEQTIANSKVPDNLLSNASPAGPVPNLNATTLVNEILGAPGFENYGDVLPGSGATLNLQVPDPSQTLNNFTVQGDIDRLQAKASSGGSLLMVQGYEGLGAGSASGGTEILYQVSCLARNAATNVRSRITAVYACKPVSDGCLRKI